MNADESRIIKEATDAGLIALTTKQYYTRLTIAAAVGAAIAGGIVHLLSGSGDEPPIRVKGGSFELHLLHASGHWTQQGNSWRVGGNNRRSEDLLIYLGATNPAHCGSQVVRKKQKKVKFVYRNTGDNKDYVIDLSAPGNKTRITSDLTLTPRTSEPQVLENTSNGYIKEIWVGNDSAATCTFSSKDDLDSVLIAEEHEP